MDTKTQALQFFTVQLDSLQTTIGFMAQTFESTSFDVSANAISHLRRQINTDDQQTVLTVQRVNNTRQLLEHFAAINDNAGSKYLSERFGKLADDFLCEFNKAQSKYLSEQS